MTIEAITTAALALPAESRAELVEKLIRSLDLPAAITYQAEWEVEIDDRITAYDRGEMEAFSREEVMRTLEDDRSA